MDLQRTALRIYQSEDPAAAFRNTVESLGAQLKVLCAMHVDLNERSILHRWPEQVELTPDLVDMALHVMRPEVFPIGSEFPIDAVNFPEADMLLLPLRADQKRNSLCVMMAPEGSFGEDLQPWQQVIEALEHVHQRHQRVQRAEAEAKELRQRVEESEALHTLGLAANRTLDKDEVLSLVARFTRTLLGAHYVTVSTAHGDRIYTAASVGLRNTQKAQDDYHLARTVVEAEKPLTVGGAEANLRVENFPCHAEEGMKVGLGIPLSLFGDTFGALVVGYRREYSILPRDVRLGLTLAGHAAVAIANAQLHETVADRSAELEAAYAELSRLSESKERFFASINHELRNPVGAIMGYNTLLLDGVGGDIPEKAAKWLRKSQAAAENLLALVNDILDLSKVAAGKMDLAMEEITVEQLLDRVTGIIGPLADQKEVNLVVEIAEGLPTLRTDPLRVQQILVNLLSNAVKFTRGEVRLAATASATGDQPSVELAVSDTGAGIPPEDLGRIFEEYEQIKGTKGGTGLGLPISRRLAGLLGGDLSAESEVGVGSRFMLRLPLSAAAPEPAVHGGTPETAGATGQ
ncbi:MAG: GAF domain-containing sensor histidine kinase [Gemmatimonadetes bacterium]|nr:GAF domain-containing sensor histidine kinase [Gemmatimonadota bacterium]